MLLGAWPLALVLPWICIKIFSRSRGATAVRDLPRSAANANHNLLGCHLLPNKIPVPGLLRPREAYADHDACQPHGRLSPMLNGANCQGNRGPDRLISGPACSRFIEHMVVC
jgi:hypothetical protein